MQAEHLRIQALAPLRVSFVGGGTDFPQWFSEHGGAVLSTTVDHFVRVQLVPRHDRQVTVRSSHLDRLVEYHLDEGPVYDGVMDLVKAAIDRIGVPTGLDVLISSQAPPGSGLGGSSALVTAMVAGLAMLRGLEYTPDELARLCYTIEREDLRISGGWQDQYAAAVGGLNLQEYSAQGVRITPVRADPRALRELEANLMLCYSGSVRRNVGLIDRQIQMHLEGREETMLGLKLLQDMAYAMRDALEQGRIDDLGAMLQDAFEAKKLMNPHIAEDTPIEEMLNAARAAGAAGGKICGAGGGGYLLIYCRRAAQPLVREALERLGGQFAPFYFLDRGVRAYRGHEVWAPRG